MSVVELFIVEGSLAVAYFLALGALAFGVVPVTAERYRFARNCFWASCIIFAAIGVVWGIETHMGTASRFLIVGTICALAGVAAMESARFLRAEIDGPQKLQDSRGGKGGSADASHGGAAIGGPGGAAGTGTGGDGGNAHAHGHGSVAAGGEGGAGPNADGTGGRGGKSGAEIYYEKIGKPLPDYLKGYGQGGGVGNKIVPSITVTNSPGSIVSPSGGNNTVINQAPEPDLKIEPASTQEDRDGTFTTTAFIEVVSPYPPSQLYLEAHAQDISAFKVEPQRSGPSVYGLTGKREGFSFTTIMSPFGRYRVTVQTKKKPQTAVEVTYKFN